MKGTGKQIKIVFVQHEGDEGVYFEKVAKAALLTTT
jgi:hypothetical protein